MSTLVLVRHGESEWNLANRFTGWTDVRLTDAGRKEARRAGARLRDEGIHPATAHVSVLRRAVDTLREVAARCAGPDLRIRSSWRLNERHYGALQGESKTEIQRRHGSLQTLAWRRSFTERPPLLADDDPRHPRFDPRYAGIPSWQLPRGESLADTLERVIPYWEESIVPDLTRGAVLVAAHGNSLRALVMRLEGLGPDEIQERNIPTGIPCVYGLGADLRILDQRYLASGAELRSRIGLAAHRP